MNQKISILGCGWLGFPLALDLIEKGYTIYGSTTSQSKLNALETNGIKPFIIDLGNMNQDVSEFLTSDVLVIAIPSKNTDGFKNLIAEIEKSQLRKILFVSSTSVYPETNGVVTEETSTGNTPLAEIEKLFQSNTRLKSTILRFGGLFGYDRKPGKFIRPGKPMENPMGYINLIHRNDCIRIIEQIIAKNVWNETLNACSDSHPTRKEFYTKEAEKLGVTNISFNDQAESSYKIVSSQKLKNLLNYEFEYNDLMNY